MSKPKDKGAAQESPCVDPYNSACHDAISAALNLVAYHVGAARKSEKIDSDPDHRQKLETLKSHVDSAKKAAAKLRPGKSKSV
jgi:hypothetical protein